MSTTERRTPGARRRMRVRHRIAWALGGVVALGAIFPAPSVVGAGGAPAPAGVALALPPAYVLLSPLARAADALCLLSTAQHLALVATAIGVAVAVRIGSARRRVWVGGVRIAERRSFARACGAEATAAVLTLMFLFAAYAAALLGPRPMAALAVADPDLVRVDFHTHTNASHDVPAWITPAWRRAWHAAAGYDLAFVSDHRAIAGPAVLAGNPRRAGDGLTLLPALEARLGPVHVIVLDVAPADSALLPDDHMEDTLPGLLQNGRLPGGGRPFTIATIPDPVLSVVNAATRDGPLALRAVEIADGAPRAYEQEDREGAAILARARALGLVPLVSSNHHGWGHTTPGWNLVRVPGWRALAPAALGAAVLDVLRARDAGRVTPVLRARVATPAAGVGRAASLALTAPALLWATARALTPAERVAWWAWLLAGSGLVTAGARGLGRRGRRLTSV